MILKSFYKQTEHTPDLLWLNRHNLELHFPNHTFLVMTGYDSNQHNQKKDNEKTTLSAIRNEENAYCHIKARELQNDIEGITSLGTSKYIYASSSTFQDNNKLYVTVSGRVFNNFMHCDRKNTYLFVADWKYTHKTYLVNIDQLLTSLAGTTVKGEQMEGSFNKFVKIDITNYEGKGYYNNAIDITEQNQWWILPHNTKAFPEQKYFESLQPVQYIDDEEREERRRMAVSVWMAENNKKKAVEKKNNTRMDFETMTKEDFIAKYSKRTWFRYQKENK